MKKIATAIYVIILVLVLGGVGALGYHYREDISQVFNKKVKLEDFTFTAEFVKDENGKFTNAKSGKQVFVGDDVSLYANATPTVYKVEFVDEVTSAKTSETLVSDDGYVFNYMIALAGESNVWNLVNTSDKKVTVDLYYTISDGTGLNDSTNIYYAKSGKVQIADSEICVYTTDGEKIETTGDNADGDKFLGQPYKCSFELDANSACVMNSSRNRLVLFGLNFR